MFKTLISATKAMVSVVALVLAFTLNASAQDRSANAAQKMTDNMKTELSLTDAQYGKVLEINKGFADKAAETRKGTTDRKQVSEALKGLNVEREASLKKVLTDDQFKTYLAKKEEKKDAAKKRFMSKDAKMDVDSNAKVKNSVAPEKQ